MASTNLSPDDVREILNANRPELIESIKKDIDSIMDYLIRDNEISTSACDRITSHKIPQKRARDLVEHVYTKGEKAYISFKKGLKENKFDSLLETIEAIETEIKTTSVRRVHRFPSDSKATVSSPWPKQTTTKQTLRTTVSLPVGTCSVKKLKSFYEGSAATQDNSTRSKLANNSERFHSPVDDVPENVSTESSTFSKCFASSSAHILSGDAVSETTLKQVTDSLDNFEISRHADISNIQHGILRSVNMLLVGCKENGKSSTGNSILGEKCFMSKRRGGTNKTSVGSGRFQGQRGNIQWNITVADTPGISPEMSKSEFEEIVSGVEMLSDEGDSRSLAIPQKTPGIDAIVLIWSYDHSDRNVKDEVKAFQSLHRLFGDALYKHLVIVVTHARYLFSIKDYIEELPAPLREIERKCPRRLVIFENNVSNLEEIQQSREELYHIAYSLSKGNLDRYTVVDLSPMCIIPEGSEVRLALMGKTGVGKSSTGNSILGSDKFTIACSVASETPDCPYHNRKTPRKVAVVDSPGVFCTDTDVIEKDRLVDQLSRIAAIYNTKGLHSMLLVISGRQRFTKEDKDAVQCLRTVFGDKLLQDYTIIVITGKDNIEADKKVRGNVETYLYNARTTGLQEVLDLCKHRVVFFNNMTQDETIQRMQLVELITMIDKLVQRNGGPYIDENFEEGKAVAGNMGALSKLKAKSTSQLPTTSTSIASPEAEPLSRRTRSITRLPTRTISPVSKEDTEEKPLVHNEDIGRTTIEAAEERVRRFTALANLRLTKLWRAIRRKLRYKRRCYTVTPVSSHK